MASAITCSTPPGPRWPKATGEPDPEALFTLLADASQAADERLPDTGIGRQRERELSARFIRTDGYGTRCSTVLLIDREGKITFIERSFAGPFGTWREVRYAFVLEGEDERT
jgi:uncharacterized protein with NRDE domain